MVKFTVIDLFCGAGGFSEGFEQMGFDVVSGVDNWNPAVETHKLNYPKAEVIKADLMEIEPSALPKADVIMGGPPCVEFSGSKRGGSGDVEKGMMLILRFFYFVYKMRPRWWIMENVPRLLQTLPPSVPLRRIGINKTGRFHIPRRVILNSADYGTPQKRLRLISGKYPLPRQTHNEQSMMTLSGDRLEQWVTMRTVMETLPNPLGRPRTNSVVKDPNYNLSIPEKKLTHHFMDTTMTNEEAMKNKRAKVNHAFYGKMKFPDDLDRPSRTVMAMQFNASRETMVIEVKRGNKIKYRKPTVRECACLQALPLTFRFCGNTEATLYKLVGNAVPVKLASALARAILEDAGLRVLTKPSIRMSY